MNKTGYQIVTYCKCQEFLKNIYLKPFDFSLIIVLKGIKKVNGIKKRTYK